MSQVFIGYDTYNMEGVDDELIRFIFDVTLGLTTKKMDSEVGLILSKSDQMQQLNQRYLGHDRPTNVLSFTDQAISGEKHLATTDANYLGDIYIGVEVLEKEAQELKISEKERFVQLFVHGLLHLLGWDHVTSVQAAEMEELEDQIVQLVV